jgi:hypothetical protein
MAARGYIVAVAIGIIAVGAGCGSSTASTTSPAHRATASTSTTGVSQKPAPLVLETEAPPDPPTIALVIRSHAREIAVPGVLYNDDWATASGVIRHRASGPTPWPQPTTIEGGDNPAIVADTPFVPDFVIVKSFAHVEGASLNPTPLPVAAFGCNRFTAPKCVVERTASGQRILGVDQSIYAGTYLVIFCQWHLPNNQRSLGYPSDTVTASWIFRIADTRAVAP